MLIATAITISPHTSVACAMPKYRSRNSPCYLGLVASVCLSVFGVQRVNNAAFRTNCKPPVLKETSIPYGRGAMPRTLERKVVRRQPNPIGPSKHSKQAQITEVLTQRRRAEQTPSSRHTKDSWRLWIICGEQCRPIMLTVASATPCPWRRETLQGIAARSHPPRKSQASISSRASSSSSP